MRRPGGARDDREHDGGKSPRHAQVGTDPQGIRMAETPSEEGTGPFFQVAVS